MRLLSDTDVPTSTRLTAFRSSRIANLAAALVFTAAAGAGCWVLVGVARDMAWWGWLVLAPVALLVGGLLHLLVGAVWGSLAASLRRSNWTMLVGEGGVWLHLRSYQNHAFEPADDTAAFFAFGEIEGAHRVVERRRTGLSEGGEARVVTLELVVAPSSTAELAEAVRRERLREGPARRFLGVTSRSRSNHVPVFVARPGRVRVEWHGKKMLAALRANGVAILEEERGAAGSGAAAPDADDAILGLIERGEKLAAIGLARETYGMGLAEARAFVEELAGRPAA